MDDLLTNQGEQNIKYVSYADDFALAIAAPSRIELERTFRAQTDKLTQWARTAKITFSPEKTQAIMLKGKLRGRYPILDFNERRIPFREEVSYLGLKIDKARLFHRHIAHTVKRAKDVMLQVTKLAKLKYGVLPKTYHRLYSAVYMPILTYGLET